MKNRNLFRGSDLVFARRPGGQFAAVVLPRVRLLNGGMNRRFQYRFPEINRSVLEKTWADAHIRPPDNA